MGIRVILRPEAQSYSKINLLKSPTFGHQTKVGDL